ncbi:MAG TPA: radical SAM protein [Acidimicrobiales bacterium]|nr:radical SAM protein [Acidimicrobiales bacterium]
MGIGRLLLRSTGEEQGRAALAAVAESRFLVDDHEPVCLRLHREGGLEAKVEDALAELEDCRACPRDCGVDRAHGETGTCNTGRHAVVSSAFPHFGEEDCLRGWNGSGTIFFGLCNLRCVFCQNWDISQKQAGRECSAEDIAGLMLRLQETGCHNINFVTPEHVVPQVVEAIAAAVRRGLRVPIVYNTSAYDSVRSLRLMEGLVDIYMPDFKFWEPETSRRLARAGDYPERAREALLEMHRQVGVLHVGTDGLARRGLIVRHLVMPGQEEEAAAIFSWLASELSPDTYVNVMGQYRPEYKVDDGRYGDINRGPLSSEMEAAYSAARRAGLWRFDQRVLPW